MVSISKYSLLLRKITSMTRISYLNKGLCPSLQLTNITNISPTRENERPKPQSDRAGAIQMLFATFHKNRKNHWNCSPRSSHFQKGVVFVLWSFVKTSNGGWCTGFESFVRIWSACCPHFVRMLSAFWSYLGLTWVLFGPYLGLTWGSPCAYWALARLLAALAPLLQVKQTLKKQKAQI